MYGAVPAGVIVSLYKIFPRDIMCMILIMLTDVWSSEMCEELVEGVNAFGMAAWQDILENYDFPSDMKATALSGKWQSLRTKEMVKYSKGRWWLKHQVDPDEVGKNPAKPSSAASDGKIVLIKLN